MTTALRGACAVVLVVLWAAPARAQMYELIGTRAQGMAGAFVAVADDATATWWNPAGLATGANVSIVYDQARNVAPADPAENGPGWLADTRALAFAYPALGLSYYRLRISEIRPVSPNAPEGPGRQDPGAMAVDLRSLAVSEYGATVGQSLGSHLVIGSTLKLVRAGRIASVAPQTSGGRDRLEEAASIDLRQEIETDLDVGAMAAFGRMRFGVSVKHLREPEFYDEADAFTLKRQVRAGAAFVDAGRAGVATVTAAVDADLTTATTPLGEVRHVSGGGEAWLLERRLGLRGGMSTNTVGEGGRAASAGISVGSRGGYYLDGAITRGSDKSLEGWSVSFRLAF